MICFISFASIIPSPFSPRKYFCLPKIVSKFGWPHFLKKQAELEELSESQDCRYYWRGLHFSVKRNVQATLFKIQIFLVGDLNPFLYSTRKRRSSKKMLWFCKRGQFSNDNFLPRVIVCIINDWPLACKSRRINNRSANYYIQNLQSTQTPVNLRAVE